MAQTARVLGIDTSLRSTGYGIVEARGSSMHSLEHETIRIPSNRPLSECLRRLHESITDTIDRRQPTAVAVEGVFFSKNVKTALILGEARGTVIAACAVHNLPIFEYSPRRVKQAVVGFGSADKQQVRRMVMTLLGLQKEPSEDAGDALAIAICHLQGRSRHAIVEPKSI